MPTGQLSDAHILPRAVVPEPDNVVADLKLMPMRVNERKNDKIVPRQADQARKLNKAKLLSDNGLKALLDAPR